MAFLTWIGATEVIMARRVRRAPPHAPQAAAKRVVISAKLLNLAASTTTGS